LPGGAARRPLGPPGRTVRPSRVVRAGRPMTEPSDGRFPPAGNEDGSGWLQAIAAELSAAGLSVHLHRTRAGLDLTATLHRPGYRDTDVLIDEDGYTELRYWADRDATP